MMKKIFVFAAAALLVLGLSTSSWAVADFAIGGSVRLDTGWQFRDWGDQADAAFGAGSEDSQSNFFADNPGNGRVNFKATVDDVTGFFELAMGDTNVSIRHAYAEWDMGGGQSLLFGHTWSIMAFGFGDQRLNADDGLLGAGCLYFGRNPQLRYTYAAETFTLKIAIEDADTGTNPTGLNYLAEAIVPAFLASVSFSPMEMLTLTPSGFYQMYDLTGVAPGTRDVDIDTYGLAIDGRLSFEAFRISFEGWWGQNLGVAADVLDIRPGIIAAFPTVANGVPVANAAGRDAEDVNAYGGFVQLTFPMETMLFNAGLGWQQCDVENSPSVNFEDDMTTWSFFVNVLYNLTDNMYIQPEFSYFDYGNDAAKNPGIGNDLGNDIFIGVHWQADF
jgi:hypothetical protein